MEKEGKLAKKVKRLIRKIYIPSKKCTRKEFLRKKMAKKFRKRILMNKK